MRIFLLMILICTIFAVSGCGQKGPLYLPDQDSVPDKAAPLG